MMTVPVLGRGVGPPARRAGGGSPDPARAEPVALPPGASLSHSDGPGQGAAPGPGQWRLSSPSLPGVTVTVGLAAAARAVPCLGGPSLRVTGRLPRQLRLAARAAAPAATYFEI